MWTDVDLRRIAEQTGYSPESLEKVLWLLQILEGISRHPFLKSRVALKGGTALNLFLFDLPRLSVDVDLNYIGARDRETMLADRPRMQQAIEAVCGRAGIEVRRVPEDHAGGKWRLSYSSPSGRSGTLELDVNFMLRTPLWPCVTMDSRPIGNVSVSAVSILDLHELAAGKLAALFGRTASRDLFDAKELLERPELDLEKLRLAFVVYGGIQRKDWRGVSMDDIQADSVEVGRHLVPMLHPHVAPKKDHVIEWSQQLVGRCRDLLSGLLPLRSNEHEFLTALNEEGEIHSGLMTDDENVREILEHHPGLLWKAKNVRAHRGKADPE